MIDETIKLIRVTHRLGDPIYLNADNVVSVAPYFNESRCEKGCAITTMRGTVLAKECMEDVVNMIEGGRCRCR